MLARFDHFDEPRSHTGRDDDSELSERSGQLRFITELLSESRGALVGFFRAIQVGLRRGLDVRLTELRTHEVLAELDAGSQLGGRITPAVCKLPDAPGKLCGAVVVLATAGGPPPAEA